ncbi:MAG: hypothetical protein ACYC5N_05315 [Endomicrobiales bacterium]
MPHAPQGSRGAAPGDIYGTPRGDVYYFEPRNRRWHALTPPPGGSPPQPQPQQAPPDGNLDKERDAREQGENREHSFRSFEQPGAAPGTVPHAPKKE